MELPTPFRFPTGLDALLGLEITEVENGHVRAELPVRPEILQPLGLVHGGVYAAVAESIASTGTYVGVGDERAIVMGLSNLTSFLRPIAEGTVHASAQARHRGRTTWVWEVDLLDDAERLCAASRVTIAVRRPRPDAPPRADGSGAPRG
ncbi:MAG TPA: PaaI family thioesterase [Solirubrobacteraceae bacterium]|nr:PaaI family thioesterase [Solirubrobacteraceae bacterium]